jgi:hypothetical protein
MTLQEQFNAIKNGKGNKVQFLKQARSLFPQYLNQYSDFNTSVNVLKSKQIINEAVGGVVTKGFNITNWKQIFEAEAKAEEKTTSKEAADANKNAYQPSNVKNADNINFNEILKGYLAELGDVKNAGKTGDELKEIAVKNLAKDPLFYTKSGEFGIKGVGYTTEAPGLGEPKEAKGKHKSSGYGDIDKEIKVKANVKNSLGDQEAKDSMPKKVKEMSVTPQNSAGVKKMKMPGAEKKMKLQEGIGMFSDPMGYNKNAKSQLEQARDILTDAGLSEEEIKTFIDNNLFSKGRLLDKAKEYIETMKLQEGFNSSQYDNMSDKDIINWAKEDGMEDFIEYDEVGELKREELLSYLLGKEADSEDLGDFDYDTRDKEDDMDPAGGYGLSSHLEESKLRSVIAKLIKEELLTEDIKYISTPEIISAIEKMGFVKGNNGIYSIPNQKLQNGGDWFVVKPAPNSKQQGQEKMFTIIGSNDKTNKILTDLEAEEYNYDRVYESKLRSVIAKLIKEELNEDESDLDTRLKKYVENEVSTGDWKSIKNYYKEMTQDKPDPERRYFELVDGILKKHGY